MYYRLAGHPCNGKWIVGAPEEMGPAKETAEVISQLRRRNWSALNQRTHKHVSIWEAVINKGQTSEGNGTKNVVCNVLLRRNINNIIAGNRNLKRRIPYLTYNFRFPYVN